MEHNERIKTYLSGLADKKSESEAEDALMHDAGFLKSFIEVIETRLHTAPPGFAALVMQNLPDSHSEAVQIPVLSRKLCAAVCFSSAAAIMLFTSSGLSQYIVELIYEQSGKLSELFELAQNHTYWR